MRRIGLSATMVLVGLAFSAAHAGPTVGDLDDGSTVGKDCVAPVYGFVSDGRAPLRGQARFDHFKKRLPTEPNSLGGPLSSFIAIGGGRALGGDAAALPDCGRSADSR